MNGILGGFPKHFGIRHGVFWTSTPGASHSYSLCLFYSYVLISIQSMLRSCWKHGAAVHKYKKVIIVLKSCSEQLQ